MRLICTKCGTEFEAFRVAPELYKLCAPVSMDPGYPPPCYGFMAPDAMLCPGLCRGELQEIHDDAPARHVPE